MQSISARTRNAAGAASWLPWGRRRRRAKPSLRDDSYRASVDNATGTRHRSFRGAQLYPGQGTPSPTLPVLSVNLCPRIRRLSSAHPPRSLPKARGPSRVQNRDRAPGLIFTMIRRGSSGVAEQGDILRSRSPPNLSRLWQSATADRRKGPNEAAWGQAQAHSGPTPLEAKWPTRAKPFITR